MHRLSGWKRCSYIMVLHLLHARYFWVEKDAGKKVSLVCMKCCCPIKLERQTSWVQLCACQISTSVRNSQTGHISTKAYTNGIAPLLQIIAAMNNCCKHIHVGLKLKSITWYVSLYMTFFTQSFVLRYQSKLLDTDHLLKYCTSLHDNHMPHSTWIFWPKDRGVSCSDRLSS